VGIATESKAKAETSWLGGIYDSSSPATRSGHRPAPVKRAAGGRIHWTMVSTDSCGARVADRVDRCDGSEYRARRMIQNGFSNCGIG
jgi:hypothetical protein